VSGGGNPEIAYKRRRSRDCHGRARRPREGAYATISGIVRPREDKRRRPAFRLARSQKYHPVARADRLLDRHEAGRDRAAGVREARDCGASPCSNVTTRPCGRSARGIERHDVRRQRHRRCATVFRHAMTQHFAHEVDMAYESTSGVAEQVEGLLPSLRRFARTLRRDNADVDDLVQATVLRALSKADLWQPGSNLLSWMFTIMHNLHVNDCRHLKVTGAPVELEEQMIVTGPCQDAVLEFRECRRALGTLPRANQRILRLIALDGLSYEETATELGIPVGTVRSRLSRTRQMLRGRLDWS
jgi:RNA polymerase sigma-70 factor, ECF subfamily